MVRHKDPESRRAEILAAAMATCAEKGFFSTRIDDIAERAGVSKGAIYHHFDSKQDVFLTLLEQLIDESVGMIAELDATGATAEESLRALTDSLLAMTRESPLLVKGLFELYLVSMRDPEFRARFMRHYDAMIDAATHIIARAMERGELSSELDAETAARIAFMGGDGLLLMHVVLDDFERGVEASVQFMDLVMRGLRP